MKDPSVAVVTSLVEVPAIAEAIGDVELGESGICALENKGVLCILHLITLFYASSR